MDYEVQNAEVLVKASPLTSRLRAKLGAQKLGRLIGITQISLGSLIAAKPFAPQASAVGSLGAVGLFLGTLSFLVTTPEAWQEGQGTPQLSMLGESLLKDTVLLGAVLQTAASCCEPLAQVIGRKARATAAGEPAYGLGPALPLLRRTAGA